MPYPADYPPGSREGTVLGVDLALLDADVGALVHRSLLSDLSDEERANLVHCVKDLVRVLPLLSSDGQAYFGEALELLRELESESG